MTGKIAPPIIDITSREDAGFVFDFMPVIPKAKMVGNMIDIKKPNPPNAITTYFPSVLIATKLSKIFINTTSCNSHSDEETCYTNLCSYVKKLSDDSPYQMLVFDGTC